MKVVNSVGEIPNFVPQKASMNNNARKYNRYNEVDERILALFAENKEKAFRLL